MQSAPSFNAPMHSPVVLASYSDETCWLLMKFPSHCATHMVTFREFIRECNEKWDGMGLTPPGSAHRSPAPTNNELCPDVVDWHCCECSSFGRIVQWYINFDNTTLQ
jgi:hypothetical protein